MIYLNTNTLKTFAYSDKLFYNSKLKLTDKKMLPVSLSSIVYKEYDPEIVTLSRESASKIVQNRLSDRLADLAGAGNIVNTDFYESLDSDVLTVTLTAECIEDIAVYHPAEDEEFIVTEQIE